MIGDNGNEYMFLLKGHEDLRQDERAMQLFGLVNALIKYERHTKNDNLNIQRYTVIPLSPNVGLVNWVPSCDTLHDLIKSYREMNNIPLSAEQKLMTQLTPHQPYENLTSMQKVELFLHAINNTKGDDLRKILWYYSKTSESWLLRRDLYTKSLATMSVVGYILGLGDRHPSNLMLSRVNGVLFHIDFGDCFELAMHREKFPEKVPFRLTRMLILAMEIAGVEGTYRMICERVMKVLRENRDSIIAMLEAFVHDPLISWKLLNPNK
jgi:FKBP12-rapamycin complex-associated protein